MKITATMPDGTKATRRTNRTYTHAIAVRKGDGPWGAVSWAGRIDLAYKEANRWVGIYDEVKVVEVDDA